MIYTETLNLSTSSCKLSEVLIKFEVKDLTHGITLLIIIIRSIYFFEDLCSCRFKDFWITVNNYTFYETFLLATTLDLRIICGLM